MSMRRIILAVLACAFVLGIPAVALAQQKVTIQGQIQYLEPIALPANATLWLSLEDVSTGYRLISLEKEGVVGGKAVPLPFAMEIDSSRIVPGARYRVVAEISDSEGSQERQYLGASAPFKGVASGTTNVPQFRALYTPGRLGDTSGGSVRMLIALVLAVLAGLIALWRRSRARPLVRQLA